MQQANYIQPTIGGRSASLLTVLLVAECYFGIDYYLNHAAGNTPPIPNAGAGIEALWIRGTAYGLTAAGSWIVSAVPLRYVRWSIAAGLTALTACGLHALSGLPALRYVSSLGGLVLGQLIVFHLFGVPDWRCLGLPSEPRTRRTRQFGIGEIVAATSGIAILMAIAIRYQPEGISPLSYWSVLVAFWCLAPLASVATLFATLGTQQPTRRIVWAVAAIALGALCVLVFTFAELRLTEEPKSEPGLGYGTLILSLLLIHCLSAGVGRWQTASSQPTADQAEGIPQNGGV